MTRSAIRKNVLELDGALFVRAAGRLATSVLLVRRIGLSGYGRLGWALTLFYLLLADDLGLGDWAMRATARDPTFFRDRGAGFFSIQLAAAAARTALFFAILPIVCGDPAVRSIASWLALAGLPIALNAWWAHFSRDRTAVLRRAIVAREVVWLAGIALLVHTTSDLRRAALVCAASEGVESIWIFVSAIRHEGRPSFSRPAVGRLGEILGQALPLWLGSRLLHWRAQLGTLVLGAAFGPSAVGAYDVAWRVAYNAWQLGSQTLAASAATLLRTAHEQAETFRGVLRRGLRAAFAIGILPPAAALAAAGPAVRVILGEPGAGVAAPLVGLAAMLPAAVARTQMRTALFALGRTRAISILAGVEVVFVPIALAAARLGGPAALAGSMALGEWILCAATAVALGQDLAGQSGHAVLRYAGAALVACAAAFAARPGGFVVACLAAILAWAALLWAIRDPLVADARAFLLSD